MAQIGLLDYLQKIDSLLEENRLEEVIAHCRHILEQHPRHVDSYRLLGKALLEQQKYDEAREIFQRILGADPEDFISHTGLAILYKDTGKVPEAIWHMERALEMDPYNAAIQVELKRLYGHRDGQEPERVALTRGALARLYFRGELYQQAAAELRAILAEEPDRIDMRTLLAETLWRADQRVDAVEVCLDVLETLPDCVKANAVLAEVWLATGRVDEVQEYLQRLQALTLVDSTSLDDESAIGQIFAQDGQTTLPERVLVDELDYLPIAAQSLDADADWIQEVGIDGVQEGGAQLDWLQEMGEIESPFGVGDAGEEVLDWLREVAAGEDDGDVVGNEVDEAPIVAEEQTMAPAEHVDDPLGWFDEQTDSVQESFQDVPDWLSEITASAEADMWDSAVSDEEQDLETDADMSPDMPDWMRELTGEETVPEVEKAADSSLMADAEHPEIPDWLDSPSEPANAAPEEQPGEVSTSLEESSNQVEEGVPEWLEELPDLEEDFSKGEQAARSNDEVSDSQGGEDPGVFFSNNVERAAETSGRVVGAAFQNDAPAMNEVDGGGDPSETLGGALIDAGIDQQLPELLEDSAIERALREATPDWLDGGALAWNDTGEEVGSDWPQNHYELTEEQIMSAGEEQEYDRQEDPEEQDEAVNRAEETAAEQALPLTVDPGPTGEEDRSEPTQASELNADQEGDQGENGIPDWLRMDLEETMTDAEDLPGWLKDVPQGYQSVPDSEDKTLIAADIPDWLRQQMPEDLDSQPAAPAEDSPDLNWLDQIAAGQGAAIEEPPTMSWESDDVEEDDAAQDQLGFDGMEGEIAWLDEGTSATGEVAIDESPASDSAKGTGEQERESQEDAIQASATEMETRDGEEDEATSFEIDEAVEMGRLREVGSSGRPFADTVEQDDLSLDEEDELEWLDDLDETLDSKDIDWLDELANEEMQDESSSSAEADTQTASGVDLEELSLLDIEQSISEDQEVREDLTLDVPEDPDEAMAWLEQLAARQGAPLEELPTIVDQGTVDEAELADTVIAPPPEIEDTVLEMGDVEAQVLEQASPESPEDIDEAKSEFEQPAIEQERDDSETSTAIGQISALEGTDDSGVEAAMEPTLIAASRSDEEAATTDDLAVFFEAEPEADEIPEDPDEAMAWLERLAAQQGAPLEELPSLHETASDVDVPSSPTTEEEIDEELQEVLAELAEVDMPQDADEALLWLEELTWLQDDDAAEVNADLVVEEAATPALPHDVVEAQAKAETLIAQIETPAGAEETVEGDHDEMPEDEDAAMAWLEQLAARQGARLDELTTVSEVSEEVETPDWLSTEIEAAAEGEPDKALSVESESLEVVVEASEPEVQHDLGIVRDLEEQVPDTEAPRSPDTLAEEPPSEEPLLEAEALEKEVVDGTPPSIEAVTEISSDIVDDLVEQELESSLPEWLSTESVGETAEDELDWLDSFGESDVDSWLAAEEQITMTELPLPDLGQLPSPAPSQAETRLPTVEEDVAEEQDSRLDEEVADAGLRTLFEVDSGELDQERLAAARAEMEAGNVSEALKAYGTLVNRGQGVPLLIADLETAVGVHSQQPLLRRMLGDAYLRNGQLQKAVDTYRQALDQI